MIGGVVLCAGDSLTHGARDDFGLSYPHLLARKMSEKYGQCWNGVEKGVNGETSADLLRRFYDHVKGYQEASEVCLWIGMNDAKRNVATPPEVYKKNLEAMVRVALFYGKPLFIGTIPTRKGFGAPDFVDNELIDQYNAVIFKLVEDMANKLIWYVDLRELPSEMMVDGIHLKHDGNDWVADQFLRVIEMWRS